MRKFTFLVASFIAVAGLSVDAQTYDVGCTAIPSHPTNVMVYPNIATQVQYTRVNYGASVTSSVVDSFTMEVSIAGSRWTAFYRNMGSPFGVSASETIAGATPIDWSSFGLSAGSNALCVSTNLWKNGSNIDANQTNDEWCTTVNYAGDNNPFKYDLAIDSARIQSPHFPQGSNVPNGTFMLQLGFNLRNAGSSDIPAGIGFSVNVKVDGVSYGPFNGTTGAISQNGYIPYTIDALANSIFLPSDNGSFDICVDMVASVDDTDHSNDGNCGTYNLVVGVDDVIEEISQFDMFYSEGDLHINMFDNAIGTYDLNIISMNGQNVMTQVLNADDSKFFNVSVGDLDTGVYIANITNANGSIETLRFVVK